MNWRRRRDHRRWPGATLWPDVLVRKGLREEQFASFTGRKSGSRDAGTST